MLLISISADNNLSYFTKGNEALHKSKFVKFSKLGSNYITISHLTVEWLDHTSIKVWWNKKISKRTVYMAVFIPIGVVVAIVLTIVIIKYAHNCSCRCPRRESRKPKYEEPNPIFIERTPSIVKEKVEPPHEVLTPLEADGFLAKFAKKYAEIPYSNELMKYDQIGCSICSGGFPLSILVVVLDCKHIFHTACIIEWFKRTGSVGNTYNCPACAALIDI